MLTRLGYYADKVIELGWLAAAVLAPLFFNVYSSRVFEPDKISVIRSVVLVMLVAWLIKLFEGGWRAMSGSNAATATGRMGAALRGAADAGLPSWLGFLRVPMVVPILVYALVYLISSLFTVTPEPTWFGSYQRLQGTYTQFSYMMLAFLVIANMRKREQIERLVSFIILTSIPVTVYGLLQANRLDPLPWAGDTATRVASTMGNAIFVAAWLIMAVPLTLYRLMNSISAMRTAAEAAEETEYEEENDNDRRRATRRPRPLEVPNYGWAVVPNVTGIILIQLFFFLFALKLVAGLPLPDAALWPVIPLALLVFFVGCFGIEWLSKHPDEPSQGGVYLVAIAVLMFFTAFFAFVPTWSVNRETLAVQVAWSAPAILWVLFFVFAWGAVAAIAYLFGRDETTAGDRNLGILPTATATGYGVMIFIQMLSILLTQSRGPWLGIGAGLFVFAVALWLVGRNRRVRWMARLGGSASAIVLAGAIFVALLNIPGSPLTALNNLPGVGRTIERLSTLTRAEDGSGKVRTLIWLGATNLIVSDPIRTIIGYGPESMYVVYNKFYPAELAHWELRNATPDRSHNVEFDHLVTMGVVGLLAYYFLVGAFYFYAVKVVRRARDIRDQLFAIALLSVMTSHFIEIQTGIQIASTWTYFYLTIALMVVFGYYVTGYLREDAAPARVREPAIADGRAAVGRRAPVAQANVEARTSAPAVARQTATTATRTQKAVSLASGGNGGKPPVSSSVKTKSGQGTSVQGASRQGQRTTDDGRRTTDSKMRSRPPTMPSRNSYVRNEDTWVGNPAFLALYAVVALVALLIIFTVNVATVQADTFYKQGQSLDQAHRYLPDSVDRYERAIGLQPNQDYYYLFKGRAYLESAKQVSQITDPNTGEPYEADVQKRERDLRLERAQEALFKAQSLNPLNTDHYANLGRLYLYWSDATGGGAADKSDDAVLYLTRATENSPGNAQLWDELAIAQARNNQFDDAIKTLEHSQSVDPLYARTPFIKGQLLEERASQARNAIISNAAPPPGGETDYGKLILAAGQAFSESIALDPAYFVDNGMADTTQPNGTVAPGRITRFLAAGDAYTETQTTVDRVQLSNVLTDTISRSYEQLLPKFEEDVANYLRNRGVYTGQEPKAPTDLLERLWQDNSWAGLRPTGTNREWLEGDMLTLSRKAIVPYAALGYIYFKLQGTAVAINYYQRAVELDPSNFFNQRNLGRLLGEQGRKEEGLEHLQIAKLIADNSGMANDPNQQLNYQQIISDIIGLQNQ